MSPNHPMQYPDLPKATVQASKEVFITTFNRAIGDQLDAILSGVNFAGLGVSNGKSTSSNALLAMVTVMQYVEDLPDALAAEATGTRMDWKYALHLPLHFPGLKPAVLCEFRGKLIANPESLQVFQLLLDRLAQAGLLGSRGQQQARAAGVLDSVCSLSRLAQLVDAMSQAIEALAASQTEWLRANALPYWFRRYGSEPTIYPLPTFNGKQEALANDIGVDIFHLLGAIEQAGRPEIANLPEVLALRKVRQQQFEQNEARPRWRSPVCATCPAIP